MGLDWNMINEKKNTFNYYYLTENPYQSLNVIIVSSFLKAVIVSKFL